MSSQPNIETKKTDHLGVLLCYNDGDLLEESLEYYLDNCDTVVAYDHGSTDQTAKVLEQYEKHLVEVIHIPREFDFYSVYPYVSVDLMNRWAPRCRWISWPDQDEFLEAPTRLTKYGDWIVQVMNSDVDWVEFRNFNFWFTEKDDSSCQRITERVRHYCIFPDCAPRIRSWRSSKTNLRHFNHNPIDGKKSAQLGNLRHYPARSETQLSERLNHSRNHIQKGKSNFHYKNMKKNEQFLSISSEKLLLDDGILELDRTEKFNWRDIYGHHGGYIDINSYERLRWLGKTLEMTADYLELAAAELRKFF